ncbi:electron transfer flavoprotein subunit alpha/FixB family protein [Faecalicatena contorta]|uniref:Electron transfer flavoprotein alpha subunit apoprotein n=1 Tax=Faecalicatena contorta TaxID=39482 RepID=A0A315ZXQ7_9FIRM|nr:electron transfer flavoprotein subunit alpha/FixB family protein [Faecalicatena contorta]PWJ50022.1 electron transfer flavoprotein alpha subunit apoprotein [Faecalicatena contorta]SUQ14143.1 electron transfer flavoprotein alpha subunit apoprotein [Faecalicatena contorta]
MRKSNIGEWSGILVYVECRKEKVHPVGRELIGEASRLAEELGAAVYAVAAGSGLDDIPSQLAGCPLEKLYLYETEDEYTPIVYEKIIAGCIEKLKPSIVLIGGTYEGRALAPRLAVAFESGLTADCTSLEIDTEGNLIQIRPAFGGNVMASIVTAHSRPQFATVRPGVMEPVFEDSLREPVIVRELVNLTDERFKVLEVKEAEGGDSITEQNILVVAGRGVRKKEDLEMLRELSELLGGKLASSRALVEKGWMSPQEQIGLSGNAVSPQYMITCGVSGTVQFMAGMKQTKNIIAINEDPTARIFEIAHYPVCGDLYEIVPELIERLKTQKGDDFTGIQI